MLRHPLRSLLALVFAALLTALPAFAQSAAGTIVGQVFNPATGLEAARYVLDKLDMILLMSVNPGFGGQALIERAFPKIERIRETLTRRGLSTHLEVDGGVRPDNARRFKDAGADVLVAGSAVFKGGSVSDPAPYGKNIRAIREAAAGVYV